MDRTLGDEHDARRDMTELHFESLLVPSVVRELFDSFVNVERLYLAQENCRQFGVVIVGRKHCKETATHIYEFLGKALHWKRQTTLVDPDLMPLLGLLHHYLDEHDRPISETKSLRSRQFWRILALQQNFVQQVLKPYATGQVEIEERRGRKLNLHELSSKEQMFVSFMDTCLGPELRDDSFVALAFYVLLFFDFLSFFLYLDDTAARHPATAKMAHFTLRLLPYVVGRYRFGTYRSDLQDLALAHIEPKIYRTIEEQISEGQPSDSWLRDLDHVIAELRRELPVSVEVKKRRKGAYSALVKSKLYSIPVKDLWDLLGVRIVTEGDDNRYCYQVLSHLTTRFERWPEAKGFADYIAQPKENGYESIHLVVLAENHARIEFQIRTEQMDSNAELGQASHESYKQFADLTAPATSPAARQGRRYLERELKKRGFSLDEFVNLIKPALNHVNLDDYFEGFAAGKYDIRSLLHRLEATRKKK